MSTITKEFTKEQLIEFATAILDVEKAMTANNLSGREARASAAIAEIALASLEARSRKLFTCSACGAEGLDEPLESKCHCNEDGAHWIESVVYTAPPATVTVPDFGALTKCIVQRLVDYGAADDDAIASAEEFVYNACRAAMLQSFGNSEQLNSPVIPDGLRLALSNAGIAAPESDEMLAATCEKYIQELVTWVKDRKPFRSAAPHFREIVNSSTNNCRENAETSTNCWCRTCRPITLTEIRFVVCPDCGNKRCPHANDHRNDCTGSNEPGQEGSAYRAAPQQEVK